MFKTNFKYNEHRNKFIDKMISTGKFYRNDDRIVISEEYEKNEKNNLIYEFNNIKCGEKKRYDVILKLCHKYCAFPKKVIEVGAGNGHFAKKFIREFNPVEYTLYEANFGEVKKMKEKLRNVELTDVNICNFSFENINIEEKKQYDCLIALEVLEHIEWDKKFLSDFDKGTNILFSVPTIHSSNHVRAFLTPESIYYRYKDILDIKEIKMIERSITFKYKHRYPIIFCCVAKKI